MVIFRIGLDKPLISDFSVRNRIYFIFERMVKKYKGDLNVWMKYVEYCEASGNLDRLNTIYPRYDLIVRFIIEFSNCIPVQRRFGFALQIGKWHVVTSRELAVLS